MNVKKLTPILNVSNIVESFEWFAKIGWEKSWDWGDPPTFGGVCNGRVEIFFKTKFTRDTESHRVPTKILKLGHYPTREFP